MIAYRYNPETKIYEGTQECQRDPMASKRLGKDIYLLPGCCTYTVPLTPRDGFDVVWDGENWHYEEAKKEEPQMPEPYVPTLEDKIRQLDWQYKNDKSQLMDYYMEFAIHEEEELMEEIKQELEDLAEQYDRDLAALKESEE